MRSLLLGAIALIFFAASSNAAQFPDEVEQSVIQIALLLPAPGSIVIDDDNFDTVGSRSRSSRSSSSRSRSKPRKVYKAPKKKKVYKKKKVTPKKKVVKKKVIPKKVVKKKVATKVSRKNIKVKSTDKQIAALKAKNKRLKGQKKGLQQANKDKAARLRGNRSEMSRLRSQRNSAENRAGWAERGNRWGYSGSYYGASMGFRSNYYWSPDPYAWSYRPGFFYRPGWGRYGYGRTPLGPVVAAATIGYLLGRGSEPANQQPVEKGQDEPTIIVAPAGTEVTRDENGNLVIIVPDADGNVEEIPVDESYEVEADDDGNTMITLPSGKRLMVSAADDIFEPDPSDEGAGVVNLANEKTAPATVPIGEVETAPATGGVVDFSKD